MNYNIDTGKEAEGCGFCKKKEIVGHKSKSCGLCCNNETMWVGIGPPLILNSLAYGFDINYCPFCGKKLKV